MEENDAVNVSFPSALSRQRAPMTNRLKFVVLVALTGLPNIGLVAALHANRFESHRNNPPQTEAEAIQAGWVKMPEWANAFHRRGPGNEANKKYLPPRSGNVDTGMEAIYDAHGNLVTDDLNGGTYNYVAPAYPGDSSFSFVIRGSGHFVVDILPYLVLGNTHS